jgi:hypothetical protein
MSNASLKTFKFVSATVKEEDLGWKLMHWRAHRPHPTPYTRQSENKEICERIPPRKRSLLETDAWALSNASLKTVKKEDLGWKLMHCRPTVLTPHLIHASLKTFKFVSAIVEEENLY